MTLNLGTTYPGRVTTGDPDYPLGKPRNVANPGDGNGTPWEEKIAQDLHGSLQAILDAGDITASGNPDKVGASDVVDALVARFGTSLTTYTASGAWAKPTIGASVTFLVVGGGGGGATGGGGGGQVVEVTVPLALLDASGTVVIGAGGAGGGGGLGAAGADGGDTVLTIGTLRVTAKGGSGAPGGDADGAAGGGRVGGGPGGTSGATPGVAGDAGGGGGGGYGGSGSPGAGGDGYSGKGGTAANDDSTASTGAPGYGGGGGGGLLSGGGGNDRGGGGGGSLGLGPVSGGNGTIDASSPVGGAGAQGVVLMFVRG
jgi:hypothetical protein